MSGYVRDDDSEALSDGPRVSFLLLSSLLQKVFPGVFQHAAREALRGFLCAQKRGARFPPRGSSNELLEVSCSGSYSTVSHPLIASFVLIYTSWKVFKCEPLQTFIRTQISLQRAEKSVELIRRDFLLHWYNRTLFLRAYYRHCLLRWSLRHLSRFLLSFRFQFSLRRCVAPLAHWTDHCTIPAGENSFQQCLHIQKPHTLCRFIRRFSIIDALLVAMRRIAFASRRPTTSSHTGTAKRNNIH